MAETKKCFKCKRTRPLDQFYRHPKMADGRVNKCVDCARKDSDARRREKLKDPVWVEQEAARLRAKARKRTPERTKAHNALRTRRKPGVHLHHWSYLPEHHTDVIELSPKDHRRAHRFMVYDAERLQYRRCDTMELLDTRERHEAYLKLIEKKPH